MEMKKQIIIFLISLTISIGLVTSIDAQLDNTSIYLANLSIKNSGRSISSVSYLSDYNKTGYNNQVSFISADEILFVSNTENPEVTDIYLANLRLEELERITANGLANYSPNTMPGKDYYSCVRVEKDKTTQHLWLYPTSLENTGFTPLPEITNVGYYAWLDENKVALFLVGTPHELVVADINTGEQNKIMDKIGRCIKVNDQGEIIFIHKLSDQQWFIKTYNIETNKISVLCQTIPGSEDFELLNNGNILMASKSKVYEFNPSLTNSWSEILDFQEFGLANINRLAFRNNKLILVNNE